MRFQYLMDLDSLDTSTASLLHRDPETRHSRASLELSREDLFTIEGGLRYLVTIEPYPPEDSP